MDVLLKPSKLQSMTKPTEKTKLSGHGWNFLTHKWKQKWQKPIFEAKNTQTRKCFVKLFCAQKYRTTWRVLHQKSRVKWVLISCWKWKFSIFCSRDITRTLFFGQEGVWDLTFFLIMRPWKNEKKGTTGFFGRVGLRYRKLIMGHHEEGLPL